jgi:tetratricopeptide (TPR) repeat protein
MKLLIIPLLLLTTQLPAQQSLQFNKRFVQSENTWVAFAPDKNGEHSFGFIYIDAQAGLTLNYEGKFKQDSTGKIIVQKSNEALLKVRLEANNVQVAHLPPGLFNQLQIDTIPKWLTNYLPDTTSINYLYRWGFLYNGYNECAKALTYLEKANKKDPNFKGLATELAFSYNCLGNYQKAINVLQSQVKAGATSSYLFKELVYAQIKLKQITLAENTFAIAIKQCTDTEHHAEMCFNIIGYYYTQKDKSQFNKWLPQAQKWFADKNQFLSALQQLQKEMQ